MKIGRIETGGGHQWVAEFDGELRRLPEGPFGDLSRPGESMGSSDEARLAAPASPSKIVCVGRNYVEHASEHGAEVPAEPLLFLKPLSAVVGPGAAIVLPALSRQVEHEAELALVVGRRGRGIPEGRAWEHVLGVTCADDVTARDLQRADDQWTRGKGFDTFCPLGPWIVSGLGDSEISHLELACRVNGELRQQASTSRMVFSPAFLIAYISRVMTLEPGDVILTGTPAGVSPLHPGDVVSVEIERVGTLTNPVVGSTPEPWLPSPD
jgi:2-keto-4-pentenoate hydratase/2-oxohepta-3-ene-1,7-dioic acid hydratase in catechol pathway